MYTLRMIKIFFVANFFFYSIITPANENVEFINKNSDPIFIGSYETVIELNDVPLSQILTNENITTEMLTNTKIISLMRIAPTHDMIARSEKMGALVEMLPFAEKDYSVGIRSFEKSPSAKYIGMNDVPVLDQGRYGTCVTFATTAALDAVLNKGDFIDQQCSLAHNLFFGQDYWEGAYYASQIITPLKQYGVVQKNKCKWKYPARNAKINTEEYITLTHPDVNISNVSFNYKRRIKLSDIRAAIDRGNRVAIGFQLKGNGDIVSVQGFRIRVDGGRKRNNGLWACKQKGSLRNYCGQALAGHEVIVVGYDDSQRLLQTRNSWGDRVGENGDYFMSYEFFEAMVIDGTEIWEDEKKSALINPSPEDVVVSKEGSTPSENNILLD